MCLFQKRKLAALCVKDRKRIYRSLPEAGTLLFVFDGSTAGCEAAITALIRACDVSSVQYTGICLNLHRKNKVGSWAEQNPHIQVVNRRDLTLSGYPFPKKKPALKTLCEQEYGIFLNLTLQKSFAEACITAISQANVKIGMKDTGYKMLKDTYDICFSYQPRPKDKGAPDFEELTTSLIQYLNNIKTKHE